MILPLDSHGFLAAAALVAILASAAGALAGCGDVGDTAKLTAAAQRAVDTRASRAGPASRVIAGAFADGFAVEVNGAAIYYVDAASVRAVNGIAAGASPGLDYVPDHLDAAGALAVVSDPARAVQVNGLK